ncbi:alpha/beta hydrolase [Pseudonocardia dioxanivorans]|uniref:alpha/beta hydrolase n=1 Tax=Pseudonocardia dioxanivorans TaxID=240495 RepID=UPI000CD2BDEF|nr:alpha/beta hydrolase [Pseudonocardia dioxanivorans]
MVREWARLRAWRLALRVVFGLPRPLKRLVAGPPVCIDDQQLDLDLQLLNRVGELLSSENEDHLGEAALAEQRRQADFAAEIVAVGAPDDIETRDLVLPGGDGTIAARLYVPPAVPATSGMIVYYHGGGFVLGSLDSTDPLCRLLAAQSQLRLLSVDYRLAPEHPYPAALDDAIAAFDHVATHAADFGADPDLLAVGGDSAGANLALVVAHEQARAGRPMPSFVVALYPATDAERSGGSRELFGSGFGLTAEYLMELERAYLPEGIPDDDARGAILRADDLDVMPPVYLATAGFDPLRDEGEELAERLREAGVPTLARRFSGLVHGYASFTAVSAAARDATLDAASAVRAGLSLAVREGGRDGVPTVVQRITRAVG